MVMEVQEIDINYNLVQIGDKSLFDYITEQLESNMDKFKEVANTTQLCKDIDEVLQRVKDLYQSYETNLAITKLQEATMWLGMNLKRLGELDPLS